MYDQYGLMRVVRIIALLLLFSSSSVASSTGTEEMRFFEIFDSTKDSLPALYSFGGYLVILLIIGFLANRAKKAGNLSDHYVAKGQVGFGVLFLTLFASVFSGYTLVGIPGDAFRMGYNAFMWVPAMVMIQAGFVVYAPKLQRLSATKLLVTPGDFIWYRFQSPQLRTSVTLCMLIPTAVHVMAQFKALGDIVYGLSSRKVEPIYGAAGLAVVMFIYDALGGMRSIVWTDVIQGSLLLIAFVLLIVFTETEFGGLASISENIVSFTPEFGQTPSYEMQSKILNFAFSIFPSFVLYPHMIQRVYAAKNAFSLKVGVIMMAFIPLFVVVSSIIVGLIGLSRYGTNLSYEQSDQVFSLVVRDIMASSAFGYTAVIVLMCATIGALMSAADSGLMSISSMIVIDLVRPMWKTSEINLLWLSRFVTFLVTLICVVIANINVTISTLFVFQINILLQAVPSFILAVSEVYSTSGYSFGAVIGLWIGVAISLGLNVAGYHEFYGITTGFPSMLVNGFIVYSIGTYLPNEIFTDFYKNEITQKSHVHNNLVSDKKHPGDIELEELSHAENQRLRKASSMEEQNKKSWFHKSKDSTKSKFKRTAVWWILIFLLLFFCVPFYQTPGIAQTFFGGLPVWVWVLLINSFIIACLVAYRSWYWWAEIPPSWIEIKERARVKSNSPAPMQERFDRIGRGVTVVNENSAAAVLRRNHGTPEAKTHSLEPTIEEKNEGNSDT